MRYGRGFKEDWEPKFAWFPIRIGNGYGSDIALAETVWLEWVVAHECSPGIYGRVFQCYRLLSCPFLDFQEKKIFAKRYPQFKKEYEEYERIRQIEAGAYKALFKAIEEAKSKGMSWENVSVNDFYPKGYTPTVYRSGGHGDWN